MSIFGPGNFYRRLNTDGERGITQAEFLGGFGVNEDTKDTDIIFSYTEGTFMGKGGSYNADILTGETWPLIGERNRLRHSDRAFVMVENLDLNKDGNVTAGELREVYSRSAGINGMMSKEECKDLYRDLVRK